MELPESSTVSSMDDSVPLCLRERTRIEPVRGEEGDGAFIVWKTNRSPSLLSKSFLLRKVFCRLSLRESSAHFTLLSRSERRRSRQVGLSATETKSLSPLTPNPSPAGAGEGNYAANLRGNSWAHFASRCSTCFTFLSTSGSAALGARGSGTSMSVSRSTYSACNTGRMSSF